MLAHVDFYGLPIPDVILACEQIDQWLNAACRALDYEGFVDTKLWTEKLLASLKLPKGKIKGF